MTKSSRYDAVEARDVASSLQGGYPIGESGTRSQSLVMEFQGRLQRIRQALMVFKGWPIQVTCADEKKSASVGSGHGYGRAAEPSGLFLHGVTRTGRRQFEPVSLLGEPRSLDKVINALPLKRRSCFSNGDTPAEAYILLTSPPPYPGLTSRLGNTIRGGSYGGLKNTRAQLRSRMFFPNSRLPGVGTRRADNALGVFLNPGGVTAL